MKIYKISHKETGEEIDDALREIGEYAGESAEHALRVMLWDQGGEYVSVSQSKLLMQSRFDVEEVSRDDFEGDQLEYLEGMAGMVP